MKRRLQCLAVAGRFLSSRILLGVHMGVALVILGKLTGPSCLFWKPETIVKVLQV